MEKVIIDGNVAVVISRGHGDRWYTDHNRKYPQLLFHPKIVEMVESGRSREMNAKWIADNIGIELPNGRYIFPDSLEIQWLPVGTMFAISEGDSSERILTDILIA